MKVCNWFKQSLEIGDPVFVQRGPFKGWYGQVSANSGRKLRVTFPSRSRQSAMDYWFHRADLVRTDS